MKGNPFFGTVSVAIGVVALSFVGPQTVHARSLSAGFTTQQEPDNTSANKQDNSQSGMTADLKKESPADRKLAQKIRKAITSDKSLSTYAHNVKVIVRDGMVTLKGPVQSEDEKKSVATKAADVAGADKVQNELTVKS